MKRLLLVTVLLAASQAPADMMGVPPKLRSDVACMVRVAEAMPGVDRVHTGTERAVDQFVVYEGPPPSDAVWRAPFVEYRVTEHGKTAIIHFSAQRSRKRRGEGYDYNFLTLLNGLSAVGAPPPSDWGTAAMAKQWKARCGISAIGLFV